MQSSGGQFGSSVTRP
nr:unnamed protein product [Callosobruchus chinensis]